jgi:hypothetical protein
MVTISAISLTPQCFTPNMTSAQIFARNLSIALGCLVCKGLSLLFPDQPEEILFSVPTNTFMENVQQWYANDNGEEEGRRKQLLPLSRESDANDAQILRLNNPALLPSSTPSSLVPSIMPTS